MTGTVVDTHIQCVQKTRNGAMTNGAMWMRQLVKRWVNSVMLSGLAYSYETCGYLDLFLSPVPQLNRSQPLYGFLLGQRLDALSKSPPKVRSMFLHFAKKVLPQAGIPLDTFRSRSELSNASRRNIHTSTRHACMK